MAGTPTAWAGFPLPAEGDPPDVPTDLRTALVAVDTALKMLMTSGTGSSTPMPTPASTGGANLLNVGPSITALQSTQSTQAGQITTLQTNVSTLQTLTAPLNNAPGGFVTVNNSPPRLSTAGAVLTTVATHTIPTAGFRRLFMCNMSCSYYYENLSSDPITFLGLMTVGGTQSEALTYYGSGNAKAAAQNFNGSFMCTIPASSTASVQIQVGAFSSTTTHASVGYPVPTIWGTLLPWSNGPDLPMPY